MSIYLKVGIDHNFGLRIPILKGNIIFYILLFLYLVLYILIHVLNIDNIKK